MLQAACDRNASVEVVRPERAGSDPPARGRLLELTEDRLVIEQLQVIGRDLHAPAGTRLDLYFSMGGTLFTCSAKVVETKAIVQLNQQLYVPALYLTKPKRVEPGQRRTVFRVPLGGLGRLIEIELWLDREAESASESEVEEQAGDGGPAPAAQETPGGDPDGERRDPNKPPPREPDFRGHIVDASDRGLGVCLYDCVYSRLRPFAPGWVRIGQFDNQGQIEFRVEIRRSASMRDRDARVGMRFMGIEDPSNARKLHRLNAFLTEMQRQLRRSA